MNRRDFARWSVGGLLVFLLPGKAKVKSDDSPRWPGQCPNCVWLGRWQGDDDLYDLWACVSPVPRILHLAARYGPEGDVITWSIRSPMDCCYSPPIAEAYRRAVARGLMKPKHNYPKYFVSVKGFEDKTAYAVRNADGSWYCVARNGSRVLATLNSCRRMGLYGGFDTLVSEGYWHEITAAEAEALLKPETIRLWKSTACGPSTGSPSYEFMAEHERLMHKAEEAAARQAKMTGKDREQAIDRIVNDVKGAVD